MKKSTYFLAALLGLSIQLASAQVKKGSVLIKNATVLTVTNGTLENSDVLVQDGIIKKVGKDITAPKDVETIDATGKFVMPGIIDAHSHVALDVVNEATAPIVAEVHMKDMVDPYAIGLYRALAGGVTTSHAMHGSANVIGGQNVTLKHRWGLTNPEDIIMQDAPRTIKFALGENPTRVHGRGSGVQPRTRMGVEAILRNGFNEAVRYKKSWEDFTKSSSQKGSTALPPVYNERLQTLSDIIDGKVIIHCHSYRADEIYMLIQVAKDFGISKLVFQHANEGFKVAPEIAKYTMGASVFADWWAYKFEVYYSTAFNAAILMDNGAITSINSDDAELIRHLYHEAAKTQRYGGMTDDQALSMITINPAKQLGIDGKVGSIEEGKNADLVIFSEHPLSSYTVPQMTFIDGIKYFDITDKKDDQRIKVSPTEMVEPVMISDGKVNRCMQDTEGLYETANALFNLHY